MTELVIGEEKEACGGRGNNGGVEAGKLFSGGVGERFGRGIEEEDAGDKVVEDKPRVSIVADKFGIHDVKDDV